MEKKYIIAVDGPAASGKSTVAKKVATELDINYIDSGAMFRGVTLYMLDNGIDVKNPNDVNRHLDKIKLSMKNNRLLLNDIDIEDKIRENRINQNVSDIATIKEVRDILLEYQRDISKDINVIMDGRDIGSKVFPNADFKFYLTATPEERASRRYRELISRGENSISYEQILDEVKERDYIDSNREHSPLIKADDAIEIDTTDKNIQEIVSIIVSKVKEG